MGSVLRSWLVGFAGSKIEKPRPMGLAVREGFAMAGGERSMDGIGWRPRLCRCSSNLHRDYGSVHFLGSNGARHLRSVACAGSLLAPLHKRPDVLGGQLRDVSHRVLFVPAVGRKVSQVGNASDEAAVVLAIDHRPIPEPIHASLP